MQKKSRKYIFIICGIFILFIFYSIVTKSLYPVPHVKFGKPAIYHPTPEELEQFNHLEQLMANDSTRYCEADFDGNGTMDRVYAYHWNTIIVFDVNSKNQHSHEQTYFGTSGFSAIGCADINHNGRMDLILADFGDNRIDLMYNNGKGKFYYENVVQVKERGLVIMVKDVNHDHWPDIIYKSDSGDFYLILNQRLYQ